MKTLREYLVHRIERHRRLAAKARRRYQLRNAQRHEKSLVRFQTYLAELEDGK